MSCCLEEILKQQSETCRSTHFFLFLCRWIQKQDKKELWLDGIDDYVEYAKQISKEFEDVLKDSKGGVAEGNAPLSSSATPPASSGFFNFSAPPKLASTATVPATTAAIAPFGQPSDAGQQKDEDEGQQDDDKIELEMDTSKADVLFTKKLHLLTQDPETKKWKDKGTGIFSLRRSKPTDESAKAVSYIVFTATSGRVLINAPVVKGLKPMINPKSPANVIMFLISKEEDGNEKKEMHLFKCGSEESANEIVSHVAAQS